MGIKKARVTRNRKQRRQQERDFRKWVNKSKENQISFEFMRLDQVQKQFRNGKLRVADCPVSMKPVLQGYMKIKEGDIEKHWHCIHEDGTIHLVSDYSDADNIEIYTREKADA